MAVAAREERQAGTCLCVFNPSADMGRISLCTAQARTMCSTMCPHQQPDFAACCGIDTRRQYLGLQRKRREAGDIRVGGHRAGGGLRARPRVVRQLLDIEERPRKRIPGPLFSMLKFTIAEVTRQTLRGRQDLPQR